MKYDGLDSISDLHGGSSRAMEESRASTATKGMANSYYALSLFDQTADPSIAMSILPLCVCGLCLYMPLLLHGTCPCLVSCVCSGNTPIEQLDSPDIQYHKRSADGCKGNKSRKQNNR